MRVDLPISLMSSIAAYLRQVELSLHRATSKNQLADFLSNRSIHPSVIIVVLRQRLPKAHDSLTHEDWRSLAKRTNSIAGMIFPKLRSLLGKNAAVSIPHDEIFASIEALTSVERLLAAEKPEQGVINTLRQRLHTCAELLLLRVPDTPLKAKIRKVEHLNSAQHLETIPIQSLPGWPFPESPRSTARE